MSRTSATLKMFCIFLVPGQSPRNVIVRVINSTALSISWDAIDPTFYHGIFLGYNVSLTNQDTGEHIYIVHDPQVSSTVFASLNEFTWYETSICGFTSKGCGPSDIQTVRTFEDSKSMYTLQTSYHVSGVLVKETKSYFKKYLDARSIVRILYSICITDCTHKPILLKCKVLFFI